MACENCELIERKNGSPTQQKLNSEGQVRALNVAKREIPSQDKKQVFLTLQGKRIQHMVPFCLP